MKNKEKYASEIVEIACNGDSIAITSDGGKLVQCNHISCCECLFENSKDCHEKVKKMGRIRIHRKASDF